MVIRASARIARRWLGRERRWNRGTRLGKKVKLEAVARVAMINSAGASLPILA
jgi:hypothetical protein